MSEDFEYPPGSNEAYMNGCTCPMVDNRFGKGYTDTGEFVIMEGCPLHAE